MLTVVAVISVAAAIAVPQAAPTSAVAADAVAAEVAGALRFAQREAVRTCTYQQVSLAPASQVLRVYQPNASGGATSTHLVDKRPYQISFAGSAIPRATIVSSVFKYDGGPTTAYASFGPDGTPSYIDPSKVSQFLSQMFGGVDIDPLKEDGEIRIRHGNVERIVRVAPVTGRVTF